MMGAFVIGNLDLNEGNYRWKSLVLNHGKGWFQGQLLRDAPNPILGEKLEEELKESVRTELNESVRVELNWENQN